MNLLTIKIDYLGTTALQETKGLDQKTYHKYIKLIHGTEWGFGHFMKCESETQC